MPQTIGPIVPAGSFPGLRDVYLSGGYRIVENAVARDAIPSERRIAGMVVHTRADGKMWRLNADLTNWTEMQFGSEVTSVFGRTGAITAQAGDYTFSQIDGSLSAQRIADGTVTDLEFQRLSGVTDNIQTQINNRALVSHTHTLDQITQSGANPNQVPVWNGAQWEAQDLMGGGGNTQALEDDIYLYTSGVYTNSYMTGAKVFGAFWTWSMDYYNNISIVDGYPCASYVINNSLGLMFYYAGWGIPDLVYFRKVLHIAAIGQVAPNDGNMFIGLFEHPGLNYPEPDPDSTKSEIGFRLTSPDKLELLMQQGGGQRWTYVTNKSILPNKIYRFMITRNDSGIYEFFVDGSKVGDTAGAPANAYPPTNLTMKPGVGYRVINPGTHAFYYHACWFWS